RGEGESLRADWFGEVCARTARMIAHWMRVGFVHGVMNTDNMSILGLTIDYGPYGWIDNFDPDWTPNTTDRQHRRYRFGQQPQVAYWNLGRLAQALAPAFATTEPLQAGLQRYIDVYQSEDRNVIAAKLGLLECRDDDVELMLSTYEWMSTTGVYMTLFFRGQSDHEAAAVTPDGFHSAFYVEARREPGRADFAAWLYRYRQRLAGDAQSADARRR